MSSTIKTRRKNTTTIFDSKGRKMKEKNEMNPNPTIRDEMRPMGNGSKKKVERRETRRTMPQ